MNRKRNVLTSERFQVKEDCSNFEQFYPQLSKYSQFLTKNKWDAEDLIQEAFVKSMQKY